MNLDQVTLPIKNIKKVAEGDCSKGAVIYFENDKLDEWVATIKERGVRVDQG